MRLSTIQTKLLVLVAVVMALELFFVGILAHTLTVAQAQSEKERHAREVTAALANLSLSIQKASIGVVTLTDARYNPAPGDLVTLAYNEQQRNIPLQLQALREFVKSDPEQDRAIADIEQTCLTAVSLMERCRYDVCIRHVNNDLVLKYKLLLGAKSEQYTRQIDSLQEYYSVMQRMLLKEEEQTGQFVKLCLIFGLAGNLIIAFGMASYLIRNITSRLGTLAQNSVNLASGRPLEAPLTGDDEIAQVDIIFHRMVAELSEVSRRERAIVDNARDIICSISVTDQFIAINPAAERMLGFGADELLGRRYVEIVHPDDRAKTRTFLRENQNGKVPHPLETRLKRKDGGAVDVMWSAHWAEEERTYFCVIYDISARKELDRLKQEFVAMVSHDLRTPLTSIRGTLNLLGLGAVDPKTELGLKMISDAESSSDRLIKLVSDLLDLEKLEAGAMQIELNLVNMADVVRLSVSSVDAFAQQKQIEVIADQPAVEVMGDEDRLIQVLVNLLSNAIKFSPKGAKVSVNYRIVEGACEIRVKDDGPGIPADNVDSVFERFKQLDTTRAQHKSGSGLGLAICKEIVQAHGGKIGVDSQIGKGSVFWFRVPLAPVNEEADSNAQSKLEGQHRK